MKALIALKRIRRGYSLLKKGELFYAPQAEVTALTGGFHPKARLATEKELAAANRKRKVTGPKERK